jgi:hypothetical protein
VPPGTDRARSPSRTRSSHSSAACALSPRRATPTPRPVWARWSRGANEYFFDADGLVVAQAGRLRFRTEFGTIDIAPSEISVIPRGVMFKVELIDASRNDLSAGLAFDIVGPSSLT